MKCGRLQLQERTKTVKKTFRLAESLGKPRRYCQKRLVNPEHEEDPRWIDVFDRYHCNDCESLNYDPQKNIQYHGQENICLSVQNLKFQGDEVNRKRPRTSFKYKTLTDGNTHRMFVKQVAEEVQGSEEDDSSQITCYYYDDYAKYLTSADRSRPSSGKSTLYLQGISSIFKENKAVQVDFTKTNNPTKTYQREFTTRKDQVIEIKRPSLKEVKTEVVAEDVDCFYKTGKRDSPTKCRAQSPETVQVIRVDVVCNPSGTGPNPSPDPEKLTTMDYLHKKFETVNLKNNHLARKYLSSNTVKTLDVM